MSNPAQSCVLKRWIEVAAVRDIDEEEVLRIEVDKVVLALYKLDGKFYATEDRCRCGKANVSDGIIEEDRIWCPRCATGFCVRTGKTGGDDGRSLKRYPVMTHNDAVYVGLSVELPESRVVRSP